MRRCTFLFWLLLLVLANSKKQKPEKKQTVDIPNWTYGEDSEKKWPKACRASNQSPIDLPPRKLIEERKSINMHWDDNIMLEGRNFYDRWLEWQPASPRRNAGHIKIDGTKYYLRNITIHRQSEHTIARSRAPMEIQFFHSTSLRSNAEIAIVSVMATAKGEPKSSQRTFLETLMRNFKFGKNQRREKDGRTAKDPKKLNLKSFGRSLQGSYRLKKYYSYTGSLSHPPCTSGVKWIILDGAISLGGKLGTQFRLFLDEGKNKNTRNNIRKLQNRSKNQWVKTSDENPKKRAERLKKAMKKALDKKPAKPKKAAKGKKDTDDKPARVKGGKRSSSDENSEESEDDEDKTLDDREGDKRSAKGKSKKDADEDEDENDEKDKDKDTKKDDAKESEKDADKDKNAEEDDDKKADKDADKDKNAEEDDDDKKKADKDADKDNEDKDDEKDDKDADTDKNENEDDKKKADKDANTDDDVDKDKDEEDDEFYLEPDTEDMECSEFTVQGCKKLKKRCKIENDKCVAKEKSLTKQALSEVATSMRKKNAPDIPSDAEIEKQVEAESKAAEKKAKQAKEDKAPDFDGDYLQDDEFSTGDKFDTGSFDDDFFVEVQSPQAKEAYLTVIMFLSLIVLILLIAGCHIMRKRDLDASYQRLGMDVEI